KSTVFESEWMVMTAVPRPLDSGFETGGTSLDGSRFTVKTLVVDGLVGLLLPQPATARAAARHETMARRFIMFLPLELATQVESHEYVVLVAAARDHSRSRREVIAEIKLQHVAVRRLLDAHVPCRAIGCVAREAW